METREEKLTEWADPSIVRTQRVRILTGSFSLIPSDSEKRVRISEENIQLDQIEEHISNTSRDNINDHNNENLWHFKAISFPRLKPGRLKLSMPKEIFQQIQHSWYLHPRTIEVFLSNNGVFTTFRCPTSGRSSLLLKVANSRSTGSDCISVTCCPTRRTINALYHNLDDETSAFATLLSTPECCIDPHFFVVALYRSHHQRIETHRNAIDDAIQAMERRSGLGNPGRLMFKNGRRASMEHYPVLEDPKSAIQQLSYCQTDLAIIGHVARCASDCGEWLVRVIDESLLDQQSPESLKAVRLTIRQEAEHIRKRTVMLLSQVQQMRDRAQSQTSLILSIITQSDADYTAAIAVDVKRDGIAMKTIAILGIVFLPGTFVATLFSMGMFNWKSTNRGETSFVTVSPSIWIYFVIALPLTTLTLLTWLFWSRRETHRSSERLMVYRAKVPFRHEDGAAITKSRLISGEKMV